MKIAIIGSGISGLAAAFYLSPDHQVTVFEKDETLGGHVNTFTVRHPEYSVDIDTGFIVFNRNTYPGFCKLLEELDVEARPTTMSFSVQCNKSGLEYSGHSFFTFFAQKWRLFDAKHFRFLWDILRFNKKAKAVSASLSHQMTIGEFFEENRFGRRFYEKYFLPVAAAIWSSPTDKVVDFPFRAMIEFYENHGMLQIKDRPIWYVISGGSKTYVDRIVETSNARFLTNAPVQQVVKQNGQFRILLGNGEADQVFDHVIVACHSDQALRITDNCLSDRQKKILSAFAYQPNTAVLHHDSSWMPKRKQIWSAWNYHIPRQDSAFATLTYDMNILQQLDCPDRHFVTLNPQHPIAPECVLREFQYEHPLFTRERHEAQSQHHQLICQNGLSFCGAYWGHGFHEDGLQSGMAVVNAIERAGINA